MKKDYIYIVILVLCIIGVLYGIIGLINVQYNEDNETSESNEKIENIYKNESVVTTVSTEKKLSPNVAFGLKKYYDECSHFEYEESELPNELVNLTRQEIENYYDDWEVEEFTDDKLILKKEINGYCKEHFLIKLDNENVNIYKMNTLGDFELYKNTEISKDYLAEEDIKKLTEGIVIFGEGKISSVLEDYE